MSDDPRAAIDRLVAAVNAADHDAMHAAYADDTVIEWPQSGERIRGNSNRREVYERMPSLPRITPQRVRGAGDMWLLEADLLYPDDDLYRAVFVFEIRDGRIVTQTTYWAAPFAAADWRAPFVERF